MRGFRFSCAIWRPKPATSEIGIQPSLPSISSGMVLQSTPEPSSSKGFEVCKASSSAVEHSTVNRMVAGSNPARTEFKGDRGTKSKLIPGPHLVYGFLTTAPNAVVEPIHPKAMPVILTTEEERDVWSARRGMRPRRCKGRWRTMC
jgi:hypothetical protein